MIDYSELFDELCFKELVDNMKKYRKEKGMTQATLAEGMDVSHEYIRRIESNKGRKSFSLKMAFRAALVLGVDLDKLCTIDIDKLKEFASKKDN